MTDLTTTVARNKDVAIYARVSTKDKGQDVENQLRQLRDFAVSQGWTIAREYVDHASGKNANGRVEFQRLFEEAAQRKFDLVLFWALDRFSREGVLATLQYLQRLSSYGIGYRSYTEGYLDYCGMFKDAVISILAVIAKQERVRISERVQAGLSRARAAGRVGGRPKAVFDRAKVRELRDQGLSIAKIAAKVGVSGPTILNALRESEADADASKALGVRQDVVSALVNLGCKRAEAECAVRGLAGNFESVFRAAIQTVSAPGA